MNTTSITKAVAFLLAGAVLISLSGVWVATAGVAAGVSAFYRVFLGGIALLMLAAAKGELGRLRPAQFGLALLTGALFAVDLYLYHQSILLVGPGLGTILPNFQVFILAAIGALFLGEQLSLAYLLSVPCAFAGLFMIVGLDLDAMPDSHLAGIAYGLGAAVFYALFLLALRRTQSLASGASPLATMALVSLAASCFLGLENLRHGLLFDLPGPRALLLLVTLALCSQVAGWSMITRSLPAVRASLAGMILLLQPALAFVWDCLFFQRPATWANWLGLGIVLAAIYVGSMRGTRGRRKTPSLAPNVTAPAAAAAPEDRR